MKEALVNPSCVTALCITCRHTGGQMVIKQCSALIKMHAFSNWLNYSQNLVIKLIIITSCESHCMEALFSLSNCIMVYQLFLEFQIYDNSFYFFSQNSSSVSRKGHIWKKIQSYFEEKNILRVISSWTNSPLFQM